MRTSLSSSAACSTLASDQRSLEDVWCSAFALGRMLIARALAEVPLLQGRAGGDAITDEAASDASSFINLRADEGEEHVRIRCSRQTVELLQHERNGTRTSNIAGVTLFGVNAYAKRERACAKNPRQAHPTNKPDRSLQSACVSPQQLFALLCGSVQELNAPLVLGSLSHMLRLHAHQDHAKYMATLRRSYARSRCSHPQDEERAPGNLVSQLCGNNLSVQLDGLGYWMYVRLQHVPSHLIAETPSKNTISCIYQAITIQLATGILCPADPKCPRRNRARIHLSSGVAVK